jgi:hypothetical protein
MDEDEVNDIKMDIAKSGGVYLVTLRLRVVPKFIWFLKQMVDEVGEIIDEVKEDLPDLKRRDEIDEMLEDSFWNISKWIQMKMVAKANVIPSKLTDLNDEGMQNLERLFERHCCDAKIIDAEVDEIRFMPTDEAFEFIRKMEEECIELEVEGE